jgi:hypothetical protein
MIIKIGNREIEIADETMVAPWETIDEHNNVCRIVLSDGWDTPLETLKQILDIAMKGKQLFVIPRLIVMSKDGRFVYNNVFVEKAQLFDQTYLTLESAAHNIEVGV